MQKLDDLEHKMTHPSHQDGEVLAAPICSVGSWQPIETAPKDEKVLVTRIPYSGKTPPVKIAWFSTASLRKRSRPWKIGRYDKLLWIPTHWTHIPVLPNTKDNPPR